MLDRLVSELGEKEKIYLIFSPKNGTNGYFIRTLPALAENGKIFMICHSFKECNSSGIAQTEHNIYKIHISHYFSFVRRLPSERLVKIYL